MAIKRLFATTTAVFDRFIDQVENHEAVADSLIRDVSASAARIRVELRRLDRDIGQLEQEHASSTKVSSRWEERARKLGREDETRALECVRRMTEAKRCADQLEVQIGAQHSLRTQLASDLSKVEQRLRELRLRKTSLSARGARADVMADLGDEVETEGVFDRWEATVLRTEYRGEGPLNCEPDNFHQAFEAQESEEALRRKLDDLLGGTS